MLENPLSHRFGWFEPAPDLGGDHFTVVVTKAEFPSETWQEFLEIVEVLAELRPFLIDHSAMMKAHNQLLQLAEDIADDAAQWLNPLGEIGFGIINSYASVQGAMFGLLSAASAFRDRARVRLIKKFGKESTEVQALKDAEHKAYDKSVAYRLCYNLRNFAQHQDSPIWIIPMKSERQEDGSLATSVKLEFDRDALISEVHPLVEKGKLQLRFVTDLKGQPERIPLLPLFTDYVADVGTILGAIVSLQADRLARYAHYMSTIRKITGIPEGAVPVIFHSDNDAAFNDPIKAPGRFTGFSFDEFKYLSDLMRKISAPT